MKPSACKDIHQTSLHQPAKLFDDNYLLRDAGDRGEHSVSDSVAVFPSSTALTQYSLDQCDDHPAGVLTTISVSSLLSFISSQTHLTIT